ncbi:MAG: PAS domain-containing protein [Clostridium sp.]|nr:PAS domain-containing protein [Clostridium sp.]
MNYKDMTKEELIAYIEEMKIKRAFTYEDQMKLIILDASPFTVWASDRNCIIKFWSGQCESLYGFSSEEVLGKDFVDLFVAPDEKVAARRDQIDIIDNAALFHNIANDKGKNGNTLQLVTNCRRIKDPVTGEYWNAEMGLIIDYLEQEKERLKLIVTESQRISSCVKQFIDNASQLKEHFLDRKMSLNTAIRNCEKKAITLRRRTEFKRNISVIKTALSDITDKLNSTVDEYYSKIQTCASYDKCEETRQSFFKQYNEILDSFEDIVLDVEEVSHEYDMDDTFISERDAILRDIASRSRSLSELAHSIMLKIEKEISDYRDQVNPMPNSESSMYKSFVDMKQRILEYKKDADIYTDKTLSDASVLNSETELQFIRIQMEEKFKTLEQQFLEIQHQLSGEL